MKIGKYEIKKKTLIRTIIAVVVIGICAWALPYALSGAKEDTMVYIYPKMTHEALTDSLKMWLGDGYGSRVANMISWSGTDMSNRVGAYEVKKGMSPLRAARKITVGHQSGVKFTFNNIRTKDEFAARVGLKFMMSKEDMLKALNDTAFCAKYGKTPETILTVLVPDSYEFYWTDKPEDLLEKMKDNYNNFWDMSRQAKAKALGLSQDEVTIIASIVEEETVKKDERGKVARLYMNRLKSGMPLQADPTVKFAIGDFSIKRITEAMTKTDSPYNTYRFVGLPPGPIRLPDKSTLDAVLNAPQHNYLYMCAKEDFSGYHNFTTNFADHKANAQRYREELDKRGIN